METPFPTTDFQFTLVGQIQSIEGANQLVLSDGSRFPVAKTPVDIPPQVQAVEVIPRISSSGLITNLSINSYTSPETENVQADRCFFIGQIVQLGKKTQLVQFKVKGPEAKTLKLMLRDPDPQMKIGQLWQILAVRKGQSLHIQQARQLDAQSEDPILASTTNNSDIPTNTLSLYIELARKALLRKTELEDWELRTPKQRRKKWEWEAIHQATQQKARVQVGTMSKQASVYCYPQLPTISNQTPKDKLPEKTRLVVTPLGAAKGIGASCFQILIGPYEIVLDCGTRPKGYDPLPALEYLENPHLLLVSHSHQDHLGAVPVFHSRFPNVRIVCTPGTRELAYIMLTDCLKVQQFNEDSPSLFDETDLEETLFFMETVPIGLEFSPLPGLKVRFINAGHILGAACIYLEYGERTLLYTGDYNTTSSYTTTGLRLADLPTADILITESTYGADTHPARKTQETALLEAIAEIVQAGGNVLIPAFALGRAQEILLAIRTSALFHKLSIPVYVDGLVRSVTEVFRNNLELLPPTVQNLLNNSAVEPFFNPQGTPPIIPISHPRERHLALSKPSVIVASSGMLIGGPSVYYASILLEQEKAALFISGYTDEESPGRLLQNLKPGDEIELDGKQVTVRAQIRRFNLSAHADKIGLTQVINKVSPKQLVLIHGCGKALYELADSGELKSKYYIHIPEIGEPVVCGEVPRHISQKQIAKIGRPLEFELTVETEYGGAWLHVPEQVANEDPRWQMLTSSGLLKAKWEGNYLKLMPVTHKHLLREQVHQKAIASAEDCCATCTFFESSTCRCPDSALFEFPVDPAGKCPEFSHI